MDGYVMGASIRRRSILTCLATPGRVPLRPARFACPAAALPHPAHFMSGFGFKRLWRFQLQDRLMGEPRLVVTCPHLLVIPRLATAPLVSPRSTSACLASQCYRLSCSFIPGHALHEMCVTKSDRHRSIGQQPGTKSARGPADTPRVNRALCSSIGSRACFA